MRSEMYFPQTGGQGVLCRDKPVGPDPKKKIILSRGITKEEYDEVYIFLRDHNKTSSGNYTLLPKSEIERYLRLGSYVVLMRGEKNNNLYGTVFSVLLPIQSAGETLTHGCTTFLNVHSKLRGFKMCMPLIRELSNWGYENQVYCSYQLTNFKMCNTSFPVTSWFRPLNIINSLALGFVFPDFMDIKKFHDNRMKYKCKAPKGYSIDRVLSKNQKKVLDFYKGLIRNKKFAYNPDMETFSKWIQEFPTYMVTHEKKKVGFFSLNSVFCRMGTEVEGKLCTPLLFNSAEGHQKGVLKALVSIAAERENDVLYCHSVGDLDRETLENVSAHPTGKDSWFSLYNNSVTLSPKDLYVPFF
tara:strand:- start:1439 stop:2506 length:1068 start_codon:yes stop_codon:yes gene_type:complete